MRNRSRALLKRLKRETGARPEYTRIETGGHLILAHRSLAKNFGETATIPALLEELIATGEEIKHDATSTVARTNFGGRDLVIKRYNKSGAVQRLKHRLAGTRAEKGFFRALMLRDLGIPTPEPLLFCRPRNHNRATRNYLLLAGSQGHTFCELFDTGQLSRDAWMAPVTEARRILDVLHANGITHGDIKTPNLLYDGTRVEIIDLDALRMPCSRLRFDRFRRKDEEAFDRRVVDYPNRGGIK